MSTPSPVRNRADLIPAGDHAAAEERRQRGLDVLRTLTGEDGEIVGEKSHPWTGATLLVRGSRGNSYVVKVALRSERAIEEFRNTLAVQAALAGRVAKPIGVHKGVFVQEMLATDDALAPAKIDARQREAVIQATRVLAKVHAWGHQIDTAGWPPDFTPQRISERARAWVDELTEIIEERSRPEYGIADTRIDQWRRDIATIGQYLHRMVEPLQLDDKLGIRPLHGDFSPDNVVASKNLSYLVDWQDSNIGSVWWEIAHGTWDMSPTEWNAVLTNYVEAAYEEGLVDSPEVTREQALAFHGGRALDVLLRCSFFNWAAVNHDPSFEATLAEGLDRLAGVARALESDRLINFDTSRGASYLESPFGGAGLTTGLGA